MLQSLRLSLYYSPSLLLDNTVLSGKALIAAFLSFTLHFSLINHGNTLGAIEHSPSIIFVLKGRNDAAI